MSDGYHVYSDGSRLCLPHGGGGLVQPAGSCLAGVISMNGRGSIGGYLAFYNRKRPHLSLNGRTPDQAYFCGLALAEAA